MHTLKIFLVLFFFLMIVDYLWVGVIGHQFYSQNLGSLARRATDGSLQPRVAAVILTYILLAIGLSVFVAPLVASRSLLAAFGFAFIFGFLVYGTYDVTNYAILSEWSLLLAGVDMLWGGILCGLGGIVIHFL